MYLIIDFDSATPIYQQLRDRVVEAIAEGELQVDAPLPSTRQLASDFGVNFHTVNKGYDLLRQEGLLRLNRKTGAVVCRDATSGPPDARFVAAWSDRLRTLLAEASAHGVPHREVLSITGELLEGFAAHELQRS